MDDNPLGQALRAGRQEAIDIFRAAVRAVEPCRATARYIEQLRSAYHDGSHRRLYAFSFGKAACGMMQAVMEGADDILTRGIVITNYGNAAFHSTERVAVYEAGHPLPDENGMAATAQVIAAAEGLGEKDLLVCLISGGGSALLVAPVQGISLGEKQQTTNLLLNGGADINELNTVRKHLSRVKGGRLAAMAYPAGIHSLILSDVIDDRLDVIASGPTAPDRTTYPEALDVIARYGLCDRIPAHVREVLDAGAQGRIPETPKADSRVFKKVINTIIGSNRQAVEAANRQARGMGFAVVAAPDQVRGEARDAGRALAERARAMKAELQQTQGPAVCMISGGETTVTVKGNGTGGRNTELALAFALAIEGTDGICLLSAGTDGTDGPTDAAGAVVDGHTVAKARCAGIRPEDYLEDNDSYTFFRKVGQLFITGPTGTNVMDLQVILVTP